MARSRLINDGRVAAQDTSVGLKERYGVSRIEDVYLKVVGRNVVDGGFRTLLSREILRFARVWMQTIVPTLLTSLLYLVVFGLALGSRIREVEGVPYLEFILPGIAFMNLVTGAHMNSSWSVFDAKRERYIDEVLISPMSNLQIALAYALGGTLRGRGDRGRGVPDRGAVCGGYDRPPVLAAPDRYSLRRLSSRPSEPRWARSPPA